METHRLICHPDTPARSVTGIVVSVDWAGDWLSLNYTVSGAEAVRWPTPAAAERRDGLWQTTCAECFIMAEDGPGYLELNFAPSGSWAAYRFDDYRLDPSHLRLMLSPQIEAGEGTITVALSLGRKRAKMGLSMVVEELDGTKSYWALAHAPGSPDFHHLTCFAATVAPPNDL